MLFKNCESCNKLATCVCRRGDPPHFFCDAHVADYIKSSGIHSVQAAVESLSDSQVCSIQDACNTYRLSSLRQAVQERNSRIESLLVKIRKVEEEYNSIVETILSGPITKDIEQVLFYQALPLFSQSSVVRSLLDLKHSLDFSDFSSPSIHKILTSLNFSIMSSFPSSSTSSTQTHYNYNESSTQTRPPSNASVQTSYKAFFSLRYFPCQVDIAKQIDPPDPTNYRWELQKQINAHSNRIWSIAISDCEKYIASASQDFTIKIWRLHSFTFLRILKGHSDLVSSVAFLGNKVVSGSFDTTIKIWEEDRCINTHNKHSGSVLSLCVSSCKRLIVSGSGDKTAIVFRSENNQTLHTLVHSGEVCSVAFSPNDKEIVSGSGALNQNGFIRIWSTETGQLLKTLNAHSDFVTCVKFSGTIIASSSLDTTVKIWDSDNDQPLLTFTDHNSCVYAVDLRDNIVASLGYDNRIFIRDIRSGSIIQTLYANGASSNYHKVGLKVLEGGNFIVSGGRDGIIKIWRRLS